MFYWGWPVQIAIMTINLFLIRKFRHVSINFFSYAAAPRLSFHSWSNAGWLIYFNRVTTYALNMLIIISFLLLNSVWIYEKCKILFTTKFLSVFFVEGIVLIHVTTLSALSVSHAWVLCFILFGSFFKWLVLNFYTVNPFEKQYSNILLGHFNMTI